MNQKKYFSHPRKSQSARSRRPRWRFLAAILMVASTLGVVPAPASAELSSVPQNTGGVSGLMSGSFSEVIRTNVWAIEQIGNTIYVGGKFANATDTGVTESQPYLAAFRADTGAFINSWRPQVNNSVNALQASPDGTKLFVGGDFTRVNGQNKARFVALDPATGAEVPFAAGVSAGLNVRNFDVEGGWLYVAGSFTQVRTGNSTTATEGAARFSLATEAHDPNWTPRMTGGGTWGIAASPDTDRVYIAGYFDQINGTRRPGGFGAVSSIDGSNVSGLQSYRTNASRDYAQDVEVANGLVWVAGSEHYVHVLNESDLGLRAFHLSNERGDFQDLELVGDRMYAGCHCWADSTLYTRYDDVIPFPPSFFDLRRADKSAPNTWIVAFDASNGEHIPAFKPNVRSTGPGVWAIHGAPDGCLWMGGTLHRANEQPVDNLVRLCDPANPPQGNDTTRPSVPGAVSVIGSGNGYVDLTWSGSTDNVGVAGYRVFDRSNNLQILQTSSTSGRLTAAPGTYNVYTRAFDAAGNESWRSGIRTITVPGGGGGADTQRPATPTSVRIVSQNGNSVSLTWDPTTDNVGVAGYRLFDLNDGSLIADVGNVTSTTLTLPAGRSYRIYLKAYDAAGNQSWRSGPRTVNT